jgi:hypothetical protein
MLGHEALHDAIAATTFARCFVRGQDFRAYLDKEFAATRAVATVLGLAR